ncbi:hypothetical protein F441_00972 [Phytophthora nicotianae CJ01A1]|uniref:Small cysteine rich protein SCR76 n=5 Tax=Phytophthora nicotianae TaxID=4792 RepID=W2RH98_PHYN3|nr:hypothetical protein PPTG_00852 [Phytophthora nicotianae INRA-310]ETI56463.1 hypothetical protein F443_00998 [Phytophthora nicotianae P1569]ETK96253.1 hypothetical protein L915_00937 [Phytophthora nicotianae]ETP26270.1 hypothetical protein F441_00972 [Phytophthora nicotianae CJ01A1]ETP54286.1 hypothetical protein F442_00950 [Phytophthora nicotianae P10297]ETL49625.1 hypothetical protein L916_00925 [Phytophthora nicotianae]
MKPIFCVLRNNLIQSKQHIYYHAPSSSIIRSRRQAGQDSAQLRHGSVHRFDSRATMEVPAPLLSGSITYLVLTLLACFAGIGMGVTGKMSRENSSIFTLLAFMTGLCLWMFWACCWLHQWHILVVPTYGAE